MSNGDVAPNEHDEHMETPAALQTARLVVRPLCFADLHDCHRAVSKTRRTRKQGVSPLNESKLAGESSAHKWRIHVLGRYEP
jgi:hypothetical protein